MSDRMPNELVKSYIYIYNKLGFVPMIYVPKGRIAPDGNVSPTIITSMASGYGCSTIYYAEEKPMEKVMLKRGYEVEIERERVY